MVDPSPALYFDFAAAYVIAHQVGHHVQTLLGVTQRVQELRARSAEGNALSVRVELQADYLTGMKANRADRARKILEAGANRERMPLKPAPDPETGRQVTRERPREEMVPGGRRTPFQPPINVPVA